MAAFIRILRSGESPDVLLYARGILQNIKSSSVSVLSQKYYMCVSDQKDNFEGLRQEDVQQGRNIEDACKAVLPSNKLHKFSSSILAS